MKRRTTAVVVMICLAGGLLWWLWAAISKAPAGREKSAREYDLSAFRQTDPALIKYQEARKISPGMKELRGIAVDSEDRIYVAGDTRIVVLGANGEKELEFKLDSAPRCLAVDEEKRIFVGMEDHVEVYDRSGDRKAKWARPAEKALFTSIAVTTNDVLVADYGSRVVWRYDTSGTLLGRIDGKDKARGHKGFIVPSPYFDVAVGHDGALWVANPGEHRVEKYSGNELQSVWGKASMQIDGFCGCCGPSHIAIMKDGSFVTSEKGLPRVKVYDAQGQFKCVVAGTEHFEEGTVGLDLAVDSAGRILVLDPKAGVVRVYVLRE